MDNFAMTDREYYKSLMDTENSNLNSRMGWLLTTQSLFFTALAFAWGKPPIIIIIIALLGIVTSFSYAIYLQCNILAFAKIEKVAKENGVEMSIGLSKEDIPAWYHWFMPWYILPRCFILSWLGIIAYFILNIS